jgi:hypothetical protein
MKFKNFLLNEGRTKEINLYEAFNIIEKNCKNALKGTYIYRDIDSFGYTAGIVDPSTSRKERKSPWASSNHYNLLLSNLPSWKDYPKRNMSLICTTDIEEAMSRGNPYLVLPFNGSKIGVCPVGDIWDSFEKITPFTLNDMINRPFREEAISDSSWNNFVGSLKKKDPEDIKILYTAITKRSNRTKRLPRLTEFTSQKLIEWLNDILSPKRNGFKLSKIGDNLPEKREVWTNGKCVVIYEDEQMAFDLRELRFEKVKEKVENGEY